MSRQYYKTKESVDEYIRMAKDVNGELLINILNKFLLPDSKILEIGSGPGTDWRILNKSYKVTGSDNSIEFLNHLKNTNPDGECLHLDAISLDTDKIFDAIYSNKVLHHLNDNELQLSIKRQSQVLNPGGIVCHSFWKGNGSETFKGMFVNYHENKDLQKFFQPFFKILLIKEYKEFENNDSLLYIGKRSK